MCSVHTSGPFVRASVWREHLLGLCLIWVAATHKDTSHPGPTAIHIFLYCVGGEGERERERERQGQWINTERAVTEPGMAVLLSSFAFISLHFFFFQIFSLLSCGPPCSVWFSYHSSFTARFINYSGGFISSVFWLACSSRVCVHPYSTAPSQCLLVSYPFYSFHLSHFQNWAAA